MNNHGHGGGTITTSARAEVGAPVPPANAGLLTLSAAARLAPGSPSPSAIWRWCRVGIRSRSGDRVFLKVTRAGRRMYVREADLAAFFAEVDRLDDAFFRARAAKLDARAKAPSPAPRSEARRQRDIARAEKELAKRGV